MQVAIRADASSTMGLGHVMRCLTLANELTLAGHKVTFLCKLHPGNLIERIVQQGFKVIELSPPDSHYNNWLGCTQAQDASECTHLLGKVIFDVMIVDHYELDATWQSMVQPHYRKLLVIDDLADRDHLADLLLDQTLGREAKAYAPHINESCSLLLGSDYTLLRPQFVGLSEQALAYRLSGKKRSHVLISIGGTDPKNLSLTVCKALVELKKPYNQLRVTVMLSSQAIHLATLKSFISAFDWITLKVDVKNVEKLLLAADLAIGASGSSAWERCVMALPTLSIVCADNQILVDSALAREKASLSLGRAEHLDPNNIVTLCIKLLNDDLLYQDMAIAANHICDGLGVKRIVAAIENMNDKTISQKFSLKPATKAHCQVAFDWQTQHGMRKYFRNPQVPTWQEHKTWFESILQSDKTALFIVHYRNQPAGMLRLDALDNGSEEVSILIDQRFQGKKLALQALNLLPQITTSSKILAEVHPDNLASHKLFQRAGFTKLSATGYQLLLADLEATQRVVK